MRARLAIAVSGQQVVLREVALKNKPDHLLSISPKGTVPVLITSDGDIIDESIDIMHWALQGHDPENWLELSPEQHQITAWLIEHNDDVFKQWLDRYKYADRHPEHSEQYYRQQGEVTLAMLEQKLAKRAYLVSEHASLSDIALFPFIRQFAAVDQAWFSTAPYPKLQTWLDNFTQSDLFSRIMLKVAPWQENDAPYCF
ncbi:UNVERIFIED_CONTAM: hypothetical protein GTU68_013159 [Idotea baltica]|nr:hypothetical protein [Idotea baltica]